MGHPSQASRSDSSGEKEWWTLGEKRGRKSQNSKRTWWLTKPVKVKRDPGRTGDRGLQGLSSELWAGGWFPEDELVSEAWVLSAHPGELYIGLVDMFQKIVQQIGEVSIGWEVTGASRRAMRLSGVDIPKEHLRDQRRLLDLDHYQNPRIREMPKGPPRRVKSNVVSMKPMNRACWTCWRVYHFTTSCTLQRY